MKARILRPRFGISRKLQLLCWSLTGLGSYLPSYAQEGEDILLLRLMEGKEKGFYLDIGAHHPRRFSNTYLFYQMGWSGINIDATPGSMTSFSKLRPRDVNLEVAVACESGVRTFYVFDEPALNTFDTNLAHQRSNLKYNLIGTHQISVRRLNDILTESIPVGCNIDFMSIDVEGYDLEVLQSNDWHRFRPNLVLAESLEQDLDSLTRSDIYRFMVEQHYQLCAKTLNTLFFQSVVS